MVGAVPVAKVKAETAEAVVLLSSVKYELVPSVILNVVAVLEGKAKVEAPAAVILTPPEVVVISVILPEVAAKARLPEPAFNAREEAATALPMVMTSLPVEVAVAPMLMVLVLPVATLPLPILMVSPVVA